MGSLFIQSGPRKGEILDLFPGRIITIGRLNSDEDDQICVPDMVVSRTHAEIHVEENKIYFIHKGRNPSIVNGVKVNDDEPRILTEETRIGIGPFIFKIMLRSEDATQKKEVPIFSEAVHEEDDSDDGRSSSNELPQRSEQKQKDMKQSSLLNSPLAKGAVVALIVLLILYLFLPSGEKVDEKKTDARRTTSTAERDSLLLAVKIPEAAIEGTIPEEELHMARINFKAAEKLFSEQRLRDQNIFESIQKWQTGIDMIGRYTQRPSAFDSAIVNLREAKRALNDKFLELYKSVKILNQQKDYRKAYNDIQVILAAIPDRMDLRYKWAKEQEYNLKKKIDNK